VKFTTRYFRRASSGVSSATSYPAPPAAARQSVILRCGAFCRTEGPQREIHYTCLREDSALPVGVGYVSDVFPNSANRRS
jgi:hypothetical protein